jgi:ribose 5-phosphate isomerase B
MTKPTIALAAVVKGFELKQTIHDYLAGIGYKVLDLGCYGTDRFVTYPSVGERLAYALYAREAELGVICCDYGSSACAGVAKFRRVCAFASASVRTAEMCRKLNGANVLCMGQAIVDPELACEMVSAFANARFLDMEGVSKELQDFHREARDRLMAWGHIPRQRELETVG